VIDAGHGGHDPGRPTKNGYKEKDIALKLALKVGKELEKNPQFKVIYTRKTDVFVTLRNRAKIANKADADLFVSIHCNAHHTQAYGTETFVLGAKNSERNMSVAKAENEVIFLEENYEENYAGFDPSSPESTIAIGIEQEVYVEQSIILARKIEDNFAGKLKRKSRGIKQASLWVMHNTYMPSVLIETGFITNKKEGAYLNSKSGQANIATAIKDAILAYKKELDQNVGSNILGIEEENTVVEVEEPKIIKDVTFKVQIAASSRDLEPKSYNFNGLSEISKTKVGGLYKYYYGVTSDYNKAQKMQGEANQKGYTSCFVVAYKNGEQISVSEALKDGSN
jgi:N-acetylmuramoyl-L-alanine amidase